MLDDMHDRPDPTAPMPAPRSSQLQLLSPISGGRWRDHFNKFMSTLGLDGESSGTLVSPTGHALYLSIDMFTDHLTKELKIGREKRDLHLLFLADSIIRPDEIWLQEGSHKDQTLMFLTRYVIGGEVTALLAAFKQEGKSWTGWSGYQSKSQVYLESKRTGELLWRRP